MKPDWKDAPEWAGYIAQNLIGDWYWHEVRPHLWKGMWISDGREWHAGYSSRVHTKARKPFRLPVEPRPQTPRPAEAGSEGQGDGDGQ